MRRRYFSARRGRWASASLVAAALASAPGWALAQGGLSKEGALFLLVPVGARSAATAQATAASELGTESLWGNPAGIARMTGKELALHHSQSIIATGEAVGFIYPAGKAGVLALGAQLYDYGAQDHADDLGTIDGQLLPRSIVVAATYAATMGEHFRAGLSYKFAQFRQDCTGACKPSEAFSASTNGMDAGAQYATGRADSLTAGVALRNMGLKLQLNDNAQSDPLPSRVHIGVQAFVPAVARALPGAQLRWAMELVSRSSFREPSVRLGGELGLQKQLYLRAGYATGTGEGTGPAFGLGFVKGRFGVDFAREFTGLSADLGEPPTFLNLRVSF